MRGFLLYLQKLDKRILICYNGFNMNKEVLQYKDIRGKITSGLNKLALPIIQTLTPMGKNVLYQDDNGNILSTNDGHTIAKFITLSDEVENAIVDVVKHSALKTNAIAGDGTTTSVLLSKTLIEEGFKLIDSGWNQMELKRALEDVSDLLMKQLEAQRTEIKTDEDLEYIARVSANNDSLIAKNVVKAVKSSGEDGVVFLEMNQKNEVEIIREDGFLLEQGMFSPHFANQKGRFTAVYEDVPVFITDKRLYHEEEASAILGGASKLGYNKVVIIARDFIGQVPNFFATNHNNLQVNMSILPIKDTDIKDNNTDTIEDIATYLGGQIKYEKDGSFVNKIEDEDFVVTNRVFSDRKKSILISTKKLNPDLMLRVESLKKAKKEVEGKPEEKELEKRIACLTNGLTTIKVGGRTLPEVTEKIYRYEDAINATRNAIKSGYVVGGGLTLWNAFNNIILHHDFPIDFQNLIRKYCQAPLRQIAENCGEHFPTLIKKVGKTKGYNALTGKYENLLKTGIIEPYTVIENAVQNSISVAQIILSSDYLVVNEPEKDNE